MPFASCTSSSATIAFTIIGGSTASEFPLYAIVAIVIINMIGIVLTPHFIVTGGGTAKSEWDARVGSGHGQFHQAFLHHRLGDHRADRAHPVRQ